MYRTKQYHPYVLPDSSQRQQKLPVKGNNSPSSSSVLTGPPELPCRHQALPPAPPPTPPQRASGAESLCLKSRCCSPPVSISQVSQNSDPPALVQQLKTLPDDKTLVFSRESQKQKLPQTSIPLAVRLSSTPTPFPRLPNREAEKGVRLLRSSPFRLGRENSSSYLKGAAPLRREQAPAAHTKSLPYSSL